MGKKTSSYHIGNVNETTAATLTALAIQIQEFVREGTLDSRLAAKLVKRLKKEGESISEAGNSTKSALKELRKAFDAVDAALRQHDASLLVMANAALRASDETPNAMTPP